MLMAWAHFRNWHFGKRHFGADISSRGIFGTRTFWRGYILAPWMKHEDIMVLGHFVTRICRHMDVSEQGHPCQNVYIALHGAKIKIFDSWYFDYTKNIIQFCLALLEIPHRRTYLYWLWWCVHAWECSVWWCVETAYWSGLYISRALCIGGTACPIPGLLLLGKSNS